MELKIYDKQGIVKMTVSPDNSSQWNHEVGVENVVTVNFTTWEFLVLEVGWYILVEGKKFKIKSEYRPKHIHDTKYTYNLKFYGREHDTQDILFCRLNQGEEDLESVFAYDGTPMDLLQKVVDNMNRNSEGIVWKVGEAVSSNRKTINFNGLYCWDALGEIARAFGTEWWLDGEYLNLSKCIRGESVSLGYGDGLKSGLTQNENTNAVKWFTRLIPVGSSKNIDKSTYGYANLQLPGREKYIDINTQYGLKEYREEAAFSKIYPHRVGTISSVRSEERTNEETGNYTVYYVKDSSLPFNPDNYMIGGAVINMTFNSGVLAGKEFEVNWNNDTSEFEIINQYPDDITQLPGSNLIPSSGDQYVLSNISMPDEYNRAAEEEYQQAVDAFLEEYSKDVSIYSGNTDYIYIQKNNISLLLGQRVNLISEKYFESGIRESRITRISRKLNNLGDASIDCSDAISSSWKSGVESSLNQLEFSIAKEIATSVIQILKSGDSGQPSDYNVLSSLRSINSFLSKRGDDRSKGKIASDKAIEIGNYVSGGSGAIIYKDETTGQTIGEMDKLYIRMKAYFETLEIINVNSVGGKQILSPAGSVKCIGVEETTDAYRCYFLGEQDGEAVENRWKVGDQAYSQMFNAKVGVSNKVSNHYYWRLVAGVNTDLVEYNGQKCHYIDLSKTDCDSGSDVPKQGDIINQRGNRTDIDRMNFIEMSSVDAFSPNITLYHGVNSYSLNGKEYVDFGVDKTTNKAYMNVYGNMYVGDRSQTSYMRYTPENGLEINATLNVGTKLGDTPLKDLISAASPEGYQEFVEKVTQDIKGLQEQIDGAIESYFYQYAPTPDNYPANSWNTEEKKKAHLNDTFTNLEDGRSWRWTVANSVYGWTEITDTATTQALALAGQAQDTADGKRRVFTSTPYTPYNVGDLWAGGSEVSLKRCIVERLTGTYDASDWDYADNTEKVKDYADEKAQEAFNAIAGYEYLKEALGDGSTTVNGGLILTNLIQLQDIDGAIMAGINGTTPKGDQSIANWWGGDMFDIEDYYTWNGREWTPKSGVTIPANLPSGLIRMDGTGYLAKGKFWWDDDGKIYADPTALFLSFNVDDPDVSLSATILDIRDKQAEFADMWEVKTDANGNEYLFAKRNIVTQGGITQYADTTGLNVEGIYDALPIDDSTIYWDNGVLKAKVAEGGITSITSQMVVEALGFTPYDATNPNGYITSSALSGYQPKITSSAKLAASLISGLAAVATSGSYNDLSNKPTIPTNTNQLTNGAGYITSSALSSYLPLSGGTLTRSDGPPLKINRDSNNSSTIQYAIQGTTVGIMGFDASGALIVRPNVNSNSVYYKVWHEGNDGAGSGLDADKLDGVELSGLLTSVSSSGSTNLSVTVGGVTKSITSLYAYRTDIFRRVATATSDNNYDLNNLKLGMAYSYSSSSALLNRPSGMSYGQAVALNSSNSGALCGQLAWDVNHGSTTDVTRRLWWRAGDSSNGFTYAQWHQIAFTDSNVASATKLLTTRYIWGRPFDGTGNVTGDLILQSTSASADTPKIYFQRGTTADTYYDNYIYNTGGGITFGYSSGGTNYDLCKLTSTTLRPNSSGTYDLGASDYLWKTLWASYAQISSIYIGDDLLFMNRGGEGIYLTGSGINYHNSSNSWVATCLGFNSSGDATFRHKILLPTTGSGAFAAPQILLGDGIARIGVASSGFMGIYAKTSIRLSQDSETEVSSTGLWVYTGGYVGINKSAPTATLDVNGTANISGAVTVGSTLTGNYWYLNNSSTNPYLRLTRSSVNWYVQVSTAGMYLGQGSSKSCLIDATGNFLSVGGITQYSQRSLKNIIDERGLSLEELSVIKPTRYRWKDNRDTNIHIGGIADDVMQVLPEVVIKTSDNILTMDYGNAGFAIAASLIKPVIDHEERIKQLEKENRELKEEIYKLKAA